MSTLNSQPPLSIPDHELLRRIGGGSYGEVWLARNVVGTLRAVKIVLRRNFDHDRPYEREYAGIQKFEPISRSHEGFVDILQIGRNDAAGCFYYVMELADSVSSFEFRVSGSSGSGQLETPNSKLETYDLRERYRSAEEMVADLELLQRGQSVRRQRAVVRRRTIGVNSAVAVAALLALLASGAVIFQRLGQRARESSLKTPVPTLHTERGRLSANAEATKAYLEGVHCYRRDTREGIALGFQHFNRAVALDPNFVMAYNGLFETYIGGFRMWPTQAAMNAGLRASAGKLMELDATLAEAHAARAWIDYLDWKWADSEKGFQRALLLNPDCTIAHMRYGFTLVYLGRPDEGHRHLLRAELLDPTLPRIKKNLGHVFYAKRQFERAIE